MNKIFNPHLINCCRPKQWTKNLLVFSAPLFSFQFNGAIWYSALISLVSFCLVSSSVYILNDVLDVKSDRLHKKKCKRPIASGLVSIKQGLYFSLLLLFLSLVLSYYISIYFFSVCFFYYLLQVFYCTYLKRIPIADIFCISAGFLLRAIGGGIAGGLQISPWFLLSITLLSLFLAIEKRKAELRAYNETGILTRKVLKQYSLSLLSRYESIVTTGSFLSYSLWAAGPLLNGAPTGWMILTVPFVLMGIFRYQLLSEKDREVLGSLKKSNLTENPEEILIHDSGIKIILSLWLISIIMIWILVI